ncbi:palmitoyltransferase ZDHHC3 isoform X2 [Agrilus planipennis]|uniref:Palmitoyltransferase n=1 Tax=Agrilus planipennis TaxID=224129 RepID=A0A1W4XTV6_AGRPL|nr:palmitoyltransferase ZDHHC3 isoform X2 [Agrilus planipennis]
MDYYRDNVRQVSHFRAVFSDPGIVPLPRNRLDFSDIYSTQKNDCGHTGWTVCTKCETYRPPRAYHCCICKRCIRRMDHHCPWINNCVGERNQKYFMQFLLYVGLLCLYTFVLLAFSWTTECKVCGISILDRQARMMHSIILLLECILFGLFVLIILINQVQAIFEDETGVEQTQNMGNYRPRKPRLALLSDVCGRQYPILWLFPCTSVSKKFDTPLIDYHV